MSNRLKSVAVLLGIAGTCVVWGWASRGTDAQRTEPGHALGAGTSGFSTGDARPAATASSVPSSFASAVGRPMPEADRSPDESGMAFLPAGAAANPTRSYIADWNRDGQLDARDIEAFFEALKVGSARADLNRDGRIDAEDLALFMQAFVAGEEFSLLAC